MAEDTKNRLTLIKMVFDESKGWVHQGEPLYVPINPSELSFTTDLPTFNTASVSSGSAQSPMANVSRKLSLNLLLDSYEDFYAQAQEDQKNGIYVKYVSPLESMTKRSAVGIAPVVLVTWNQKRYIEAGTDVEGAKFENNDDKASSFFGVISNFSVKYSLFHTDGTPLRGTVSLTLTEASMNPAQQAQ